MALDASALFCTFFPCTVAFTVIFLTVASLAFTTWTWISFRHCFSGCLIVTTINARTFGCTSSPSFKTFTVILLALSLWAVAFRNFRSFYGIALWGLSFGWDSLWNRLGFVGVLVFIEVEGGTFGKIVIFDGILLNKRWLFDKHLV